MDKTFIGIETDHISMRTSYRDMTEPRHLAISATNLRGPYLGGDPFAVLRSSPPDPGLAPTLYVYRIVSRLTVDDRAHVRLWPSAARMQPERPGRDQQR